MKFLRFLCNLCLFIFTTIAISVVQVAGYDLVASQDNFGLNSDAGSSIEVITVVPSDDKVEFIDTFKFWGTDIATGVKTQPKYRIRSWGDGNWWSKSMGWADIALDSTIAVFKPIFTPIAQVNAVKDYYLTDAYTINSVYHRNGKDVLSDGELYEMYVLFSDFTYGDGMDAAVLDSKSTQISLLDYESLEESERFFKVSEGEYYYGDEKIGTLEDLEKWCSDEANFIKWAKRHKLAYNIDWKLQKYNQKAYTKYFRKFIYSEVMKDNVTGQIHEIRTIKSSVVTLYFIQFTSIIIALIFVIKYPVSLLQARWEAGKEKRRLKREGK